MENEPTAQELLEMIQSLERELKLLSSRILGTEMRMDIERDNSTRNLNAILNAKNNRQAEGKNNGNNA